MKARKKTLFVIAYVLLAIATAAVAFVLSQDDIGYSPNDTVRVQPGLSNKPRPNPDKSQEVTLQGTFGCLAHRGDGPHTMECAFGLMLDDGRVYALGSDDPMSVAAISTGTRIEVTGMLRKVPDKKYLTDGTVQVTSLKQP